MPEPLRIAVIIPYFQERRGVLARSLASVFAQVVAPSVLINVFVVDDASPLDPAGDIADAGALPAHATVKILRRANGGPGAARNTGLDAAVGEHDVVAFLDSDDVWRGDHLARAQRGLESGADLYFCDFNSPDYPDGYLQSTEFYADLINGDGTALSEGSCGVDIWTCEGAYLGERVAREYLAQTSTIVYRVERLGGVRFSELLRVAGEDHLFFLDLALATRRASISLACEVERGSGVNVYDAARAWGDARDLRRRIYNLGALNLMRARAPWSGSTLHLLKQRLKQSRRTVGFLLLRQMIASRSIPSDALELAWRCDKLAAVLFPLNAVAFWLGNVAGLNSAERER